MDANKIFQSRAFKITIGAIGALVIGLLIFQLGMFVGFRKASFSYGWGDNYHRNFAGPRQGFVNDLVGRDFIDAHGVFGTIMKIDLPNLLVKGNNSVEKDIILQDDTVIKRFQETINPGNLKVDDNIVIIGDPNDAGQIEAKLIRIVPPPLGQADNNFPAPVQPGDLNQINGINPITPSGNK